MLWFCSHESSREAKLPTSAFSPRRRNMKHKRCPSSPIARRSATPPPRGRNCMLGRRRPPRPPVVGSSLVSWRPNDLCSSKWQSVATLPDKQPSHRKPFPGVVRVFTLTRLQTEMWSGSGDMSVSRRIRLRVKRVSHNICSVVSFGVPLEFPTNGSASHWRQHRLNTSAGIPEMPVANVLSGELKQIESPRNTKACVSGCCVPVRPV